MSRTRTEPLVRYSSPFGSPAWMTRERAAKLCIEDDRLWLLMQEVGNLSEQQRKHGPPFYSVPSEGRRR